MDIGGYVKIGRIPLVIIGGGRSHSTEYNQKYFLKITVFFCYIQCLCLGMLRLAERWFTISHLSG